KFALLHKARDERGRFVRGGRDQHALARAQSIGFDHQRPIYRAKRRVGVNRIIENSIERRGRYSVALHELLRKYFASLELRTLRSRPQDGQPASRQLVSDTVD